jgi:hypothetical protein
VVAGSNPVSPTEKKALSWCDVVVDESDDRSLGPFWDRYPNPYPNQDLRYATFRGDGGRLAHRRALSPRRLVVSATT